MSAASQIGIDSCAIEGFDRQKVENILQDLNIVDSNHFGISCMVAFGYRDHNPEFPKTRNSLEDIVKYV
ncbi:putative NAD(P)H nitroreductase YfkO [compost metagenome]